MADIVLNLELIAKLLEIRMNDVKVGEGNVVLTNVLGANGLIAPSGEMWSVTEKGVVYCRWLCEVPMPVQTWNDPRKASK